MKASEIREKFQQFFEYNGHKRIPSASLVPVHDPTVLFTTAGMHPLVPFLMGEKHPVGKRLVNVQKCLRTDDIDQVGDETHNTFFEMLGNWSLGDYWKQESIAWSYEFLTGKDWLGLDKNNLAVSVFTGDDDALRDEESAKIWLALGIPQKRLAYLGKKDNWWGPPGATGPCGPDTEIFYWIGKDSVPEEFDSANKNWVEIWNNVFMQYEKTAEGEFIPLKQKNVDTGMGLERVTTVLQNNSSIYETDLFLPIIQKIKSLGNASDERSIRIIADHMRAATFLIADGVVPSNKDRGYILRRLIRRAITYGKKIGIVSSFTVQVAGSVIEVYGNVYPELVSTRQQIESELEKEENKFRETLSKGLKELELEVARHLSHEVTGVLLFNLFATHGFPVELSIELANEKKYKIRKDAQSLFEKLIESHKNLSRTASAGQFKGGLASHSEKVVRLHTVTHLMNAALRKVLGEKVFQKGSNITEERTRFDFTHDQKLTDEQKQEVERLVNDWIMADLPVTKEILPIEEAKNRGAIGVFGEKYGETVSIYTIQDPKTNTVISREFCGGPHVERTKTIGSFKIQKEEAVSAGVRRIKAIIE